MTFFLFIIYFCFYICIFFCFLSFLDFDGFKSSFYFSLGSIFCGIKMSLGLNSIYSYFFVLIFLTGILSLLIYFSSLNFYFNNFFGYSIFFFFFIFLMTFSLDFNFIITDFNFCGCYTIVNFFYYFWIILILFMFLFFLSLGLNFRGCLRFI